MTRAERAALRAQRLKDERDAKHRALVQAQARQRAAERQERTKRRYQVGLIAAMAGLLVWDDPTLTRLLTLLRPLTEAPNPEAMLESLCAVPEALDPDPLEHARTSP